MTDTITTEAPPVTIIVTCPHCGYNLFELLPLGISGTGSSVCARCRRPIAPWAHEQPKRIDAP